MVFIFPAGDSFEASAAEIKHLQNTEQVKYMTNGASDGADMMNLMKLKSLNVTLIM